MPRLGRVNDQTTLLWKVWGILHTGARETDRMRAGSKSASWSIGPAAQAVPNSESLWPEAVSEREGGTDAVLCPDSTVLIMCWLCRGHREICSYWLEANMAHGIWACMWVCFSRSVYLRLLFPALKLQMSVCFLEDPGTLLTASTRKAWLSSHIRSKAFVFTNLSRQVPGPLSR